MQLGIILVICLFLLCITEAVEIPYRILGFRPYASAALCILLCIANAFPVALSAQVSINPAAVLLVGMLAVLAFHRDGFRACRGILLSIFSACVAILLFQEHMPSFEPGLWVGILTGGASILLHTTPFTALFSAVFAPLLYGGLSAFIDSLSYGYTTVYIGGTIQFDAQIAGLFIAGVLLCLMLHRRAHMPE